MGVKTSKVRQIAAVAVLGVAAGGVAAAPALAANYGPPTHNC